MVFSLADFYAAANDADVATDLVSDLNDLAQWVIDDNTLRRVAGRLSQSVDAPPQIDGFNKRPGACLLPLVGTPGTNSTLSEGYFLPVHWQSGGVHDGRLPLSLRATADEVLRVLGLPGHSLHLMLPGQRGPDREFLPDVTDDMGSAFAALGGGLRMLQTQTSPDFLTVCTGRFENGRIAPVSHVFQKTKAVLEFPPRSEVKRFRNWIVPPGSGIDEVSKAIAAFGNDSSATQLTVRVFSETGDIQQQLNTLLACSGMRPDPGASFVDLQDFYQWVIEHDPNQANEYYQKVLYQQILERGFVGGPPSEARPTHFVAVVSSPELIGLAHRLFRFERALILYTAAADASSPDSKNADFSDRATAAKGLIEGDGCPDALPAPIEYQPTLSGPALWKSIRDAMSPHVNEFLKGVQPGGVMWDMTSGLRIFSHVLEKSFARRGDWMLAINQQWSSRRGIRIPCTETLAVWKHGFPIE